MLRGVLVGSPGPLADHMRRLGQSVAVLGADMAGHTGHWMHHRMLIVHSGPGTQNTNDGLVGTEMGGPFSGVEEGRPLLVDEVSNNKSRPWPGEPVRLV